jgi:hypothetical protein
MLSANKGNLVQVLCELRHERFMFGCYGIWRSAALYGRWGFEAGDECGGLIPFICG